MPLSRLSSSPGIGLRVSYEFGNRVDAELGRDGKHLRRTPDQPKRRKILGDVVTDLLHRRHQHESRDTAEQQRIAIGLAERHRLGTGNAAGGWAVFGDQRLAEMVPQHLGDGARRGVGRPAGGKRDDDGHRPRWKVLRQAGRERHPQRQRRAKSPGAQGPCPATHLHIMLPIRLYTSPMINAAGI
jgi:hypothetical protein